MDNLDVKELNKGIDEEKEMEKVKQKLKPDPIFFNIMDDKSKVVIDNLSAPNISSMIFLSLISIFDKYSKHTEIIPSFSGFNFIEAVYDDSNNITGFIIEFMEDKKYTLKINVIKNNIDKDIFNTIRIRIEDNLICVFTRDGRVTNAYMNAIMIPYNIIDNMDNKRNMNNILTAIQFANRDSYKDLHDTILGYSIMLSYNQTFFTATATCHEKDLDKDFEEDGLTGRYIAYRRCLMKKIKCDIAISSQYVNNLRDIIDKQYSIVRKHSRTIIKCKKSYDRIKKQLRDI